MVNLSQKQQTTLPTMYDLPSEEVGESGLPDLFHPLQSEFLRLTFQPATYPSEQVLAAMDLNIYYDPNNTRRYKRPDWFGVVGVPYFEEEQGLRLSYVIWQEGVNPFIVVELLSASTQKEDLGETEPEPDKPPTKWQVYEEILQVPYYVVYDLDNTAFRAFHHQGGRYQELQVPDNRLWLPHLGIGLGLWQGSYQKIDRLWLRFYDASGNWIPTPEERERQRAEQERQRAEQERQRAEQERQRAEEQQQRAEEQQQQAERFRRLLLENGINPDEV
ncbi:Uma2 family endonuclease [Roseofilum sp. BLCC_M154]|uniref:Uma2 family endonuclease n=1 Tax=Roseofilum acuticapitatum BLCC-M154 TaxID=3022444 RepID=A0ABT7ARW6_9CYAN|nr:Uma2 family endonuclease [Roseofilum acuticapitatum]MDJ1169646.1 Uma2 family endonuclease [Roseofilum acuticapitatum BLCC-M154]